MAASRLEAGDGVYPAGRIVCQRPLTVVSVRSTGTALLTVAASQGRTEKVLWHVPTVRSGGHIRFLSSSRVQGMTPEEEAIC
jgi:hypothetical protein